MTRFGEKTWKKSGDFQAGDGAVAALFARNRHRPGPSALSSEAFFLAVQIARRGFRSNRFDMWRLILHFARMQAMQFEQSVVSILKRDPRFHPHAYFFLKDALDFTLKRIAEAHGGQARHVSGPELLAGFRDFALEQFGPMGSTLMSEWGVRKCQDVGDMVFHLIQEQVFGKQDSDRREDFSEIFDFEEALVKPFLPRRKTALQQVSPQVDTVLS
jgi:uncharacterized repeat protein (TIGR04138 family)